VKTEVKLEKRVFSVELKSKGCLKNISLGNGSGDSVLVEGTIGDFLQASFADGIVLEVVGREGILRIDLREDEIEKKPTNQMEVKTQ
jgi:hypothetical protein